MKLISGKYHETLSHLKSLTENGKEMCKQQKPIEILNIIIHFSRVSISNPPPKKKKRSIMIIK